MRPAGDATRRQTITDSLMHFFAQFCLSLLILLSVGSVKTSPIERATKLSIRLCNQKSY